MAATTLTKLVSRTPSALSPQQRLDIRNYVLNYLATRGKLAHFVTQALVQLYARITKTGWFECVKDECVFKNVLPQIRPFLQVRLLCHLNHHIYIFTLAKQSFGSLFFSSSS